MNLEGKLIGNRYEIQEKIGNGGMATVYRAQDTVLKRFVAVKVLRDEFTTDNEFIRRFNTEAQSAASLTHPNIVSIYDVGNEENIYYIVMELIQGKTLKQIIDEDGVLPWKWSIDIASQIASALEVAHKNNIVHRDIKPHNIIITEDGVAKVTDFGIAKAVSNSTITAFGTTIGSVHYFSPEHARGGYTDAKSDLYSLGVVMYEMLTGRVPFDADTPVSVALKHMQEKPIEPIKLNPAIPYSVNKIIIKAMEKDINLRYQSATEMLKDLNMALKDPDGNFVQMSSNDMAYTQRIETITDEELNRNKPSQSTEKNKKKGKIGQYLKKHPAVKIILIILLIIIIPVAAFFGVQGMLNMGRVDDVPLPNFTNMTKEEAENEAQKAGIKLEVSEEYSSEVEAGKVASQEPSYLEGYLVKEGSTVKIVISKGENIKNVPKVTGMTSKEAKEAIEAEELKIEVVEETSREVEAGIVIKQEPKANEEVNAGETVTIYVSTGIKQITMNHVVGKPENEAKKTLTGLGFEVNVVYEEDSSKSDGVVLKQSIDVGTTVDEGTSVTLTVNKIEAIREGTVNIDLSSLTGGVIETDEDGNEINPTVKLRIEVNDETVYNDEQRKDNENFSRTISGKGTVTVKVFIDGVKEAEKQLNMNSSNPTLDIFAN